LGSEVAVTDLVRMTGTRSRKLDGLSVHVEFVKWVHDECSSRPSERVSPDDFVA